jgi:hypothetical protein
MIVNAPRLTVIVGAALQFVEFATITFAISIKVALPPAIVAPLKSIGEPNTHILHRATVWRRLAITAVTFASVVTPCFITTTTLSQREKRRRANSTTSPVPKHQSK